MRLAFVKQAMTALCRPGVNAHSYATTMVSFERESRQWNIWAAHHISQCTKARPKPTPSTIHPAQHA